jgi:hypothetical protein
MPSPDTPEKSGNEPPYPRGAGFAKLLDWHLDFGTRPNVSPNQPGRRWSNAEFAKKVDTTDKSVRNWRAGRVLPDDLGSIEYVLFGNNIAYKEWRFDLRVAYDRDQVPITDGSIPAAPQDFLGRDEDVREVLDVLLSPAPARAILIQGPPGIGKTALTQAVGNNEAVIERFGDANRSKPRQLPLSCRMP